MSLVHSAESDERRALCSQASTDANESLAGTAAEGVRFWIALEYARPWEPKPLGPSELPAEVKAHLNAAIKDIDGARLQFIRKPGRTGGDPQLLVGCAAHGGTPLLRFELSSYAALTDIDLHEVARTGTHPDATFVEHPVHLVCVHGKRDKCCATFGSAVFRAICQQGDVEVWQTSHLGGHRFAACVLSLPHGICYGRVRPEHAAALVRAHRDGDIFSLDHLRGRCALWRDAQAAEIYLRQRNGNRELGAHPWIETRCDAQDGTSHVRFGVGSVDGATENVTVRRELLPVHRPASCGGEPEPVSSYTEIG